MTDNLEQRIVKIIAQIIDKPPNSISSNSSFEELGLTSLDAVTIMYELEQEFDIEIPDTEANTISSVQELIEGVRKLSLTESGA